MLEIKYFKSEKLYLSSIFDINILRTTHKFTFEKYVNLVDSVDNTILVFIPDGNYYKEDNNFYGNLTILSQENVGNIDIFYVDIEPCDLDKFLKTECLIYNGDFTLVTDSEIKLNKNPILKKSKDFLPCDSSIEFNEKILNIIEEINGFYENFYYKEENLKLNNVLYNNKKWLYLTEENFNNSLKNMQRKLSEKDFIDQIENKLYRILKIEKIVKNDEEDNLVIYPYNESDKSRENSFFFKNAKQLSETVFKEKLTTKYFLDRYREFYNLCQKSTQLKKDTVLFYHNIGYNDEEMINTKDLFLYHIFERKFVYRGNRIYFYRVKENDEKMLKDLEDYILIYSLRKTKIVREIFLSEDFIFTEIDFEDNENEEIVIKYDNSILEKYRLKEIWENKLPYFLFFVSNRDYKRICFYYHNQDKNGQIYNQLNNLEDIYVSNVEYTPEIGISTENYLLLLESKVVVYPTDREFIEKSIENGNIYDNDKFFNSF